MLKSLSIDYLTLMALWVSIRDRSVGMTIRTEGSGSEGHDGLTERLPSPEATMCTDTLDLVVAE